MAFSLESNPDASIECRRDLSTVRCLIVPRTVFPQSLSGKPGVYLLVDETHRAVYVGESANLAKRHANHQSGFSWWEFAAYFFEVGGSWFSATDSRRFLQQRLFDGCRSLGSRIVFVSKIAGSDSPKPKDGDAYLSAILDFCRVLRLPVSQPSIFTQTLAPAVEIVGAIVPDDPQSPPSHLSSSERWRSVQALAQALAKQYGGSVQGIFQVLTRYRGRKAGSRKWKPILDNLGVKFDADGLISDWSEVPCPLP